MPVPQLIAGGNASLTLMHDCLVHALLGGVPGGEAPWAGRGAISFLCPVPGYDRHFALLQRFGIGMISVPMTPSGPDLDACERLAAADPAVKGIWCVPKYSNPDGTVYSGETVRRLAAMPAAAPDFRIFWDNAYAVHDLTDDPPELADMLAAAAEAGHPDRPLVFGSTSKVTFAGAGVGFLGASPANVAWFLGRLGKGSIGPDKVNHLRHAMFLRDEAGLRAHMRRHRDLLAPKFAAVQRILSAELGGTGAGPVDRSGRRVLHLAGGARRVRPRGGPAGRGGRDRADPGRGHPSRRARPAGRVHPDRAHLPAGGRPRAGHRGPGRVRPAGRADRHRGYGKLTTSLGPGLAAVTAAPVPLITWSMLPDPVRTPGVTVNAG